MIKILAWAAAINLTTMGLAPARLMLCFHSDGDVVLEDFQESCCRSTCGDAGACASDECEGAGSRSECPDDQCHDLPLKFSIEGKVESPSGGFDTPDLGPSALDLYFSGEGPVLRAAKPRSDARASPFSLATDHLRTVVLRF